MSEFRFEKLRVPAELALTTGGVVSGWFFVSGTAALHDGPERVGDLLNERSGFFPFERSDGATVLYNRSQLVTVSLPEGMVEAELDPGYEVATHRGVAVLLTNGVRVTGTVAVYRPIGHDRLSDYASCEEQFRYLVTAEQTLILNAAHIVELVETAD